MRTAGTVLRDGVWWVVAGLVLGLLVAVLLQLFLLPRTYTSAATYYVSPRAGAPAVAGGDGRIESYEALAESARVAGDASGLLGGDPNAAQVQDAVSSSRQGSVLVIRAGAGSPRDAALLNSAVGTAFTRLVDQVERADQPAGAPVLGVQLVDPPSEPSTPTSPRWAVLLPWGAVLGLVLGVIAAVARSRTRRSVASPEALVLRLGGPVLGVVPERRRPPRHPAPLLEPPAGDVRDRGARRHTAVHLRLRSALRSATPCGVLVLVGAGREQGTTTLALDVAVGLATGGERVVLVDTDRRTGPVAARLELAPAPGLTQVASRRATLERSVQHWAPGALDVLAAGAPLPDDDAQSDVPIEASALVVDALRSRYDRVVVDTAGSLAGGAGIALARHADAVVVVVRRGALDEDVDATVAALRLAGAPVIGGVLTRAGSVPAAPAGPRPAAARDGEDDAPTGPVAVPTAEETDGRSHEDGASGPGAVGGPDEEHEPVPATGQDDAGQPARPDEANGTGDGTPAPADAAGSDTGTARPVRRQRRRATRPHPVTPAEAP